jgi:hypothetical protein
MTRLPPIEELGSSAADLAHMVPISLVWAEWMHSLLATACGPVDA